jgi:hypothetical protein
MMQADPPLTGDFEIVGEIVGQHTENFSASGFEFAEVTWEGSPNLIRYPVFKFVNQRVGLSIRILFFPAQTGRNGGFVVSISKPVNHVLNVEDYLKFRGQEDFIPFFTYRDPNTDVRAFSEAFFQMLGRLLRGQLAPILQGKAWEDTPIDWMGYK